MAGDDDPFFAFPGSNDRTVIRPVPGGRAQDIPRNTNTGFTGSVLPGISLARLGNLNPLEKAASALLALIANLYNRPSHAAPERLRQQLADEVRSFHGYAAQAGIDQGTIQLASHALCTTLDEAVFNTPWGQQGGWAEHGLLSEFHRSVAGGKEFFQHLKDLGQQPDRNLHLLELMYLCLSLGFQGRYRMAADGKQRLEQIQAWLMQLIRQQRGSSEAALSPHWKGVKVKREGFTRVIPLWVFYALAAGLGLVVFLGLLMALGVHASPVKQSINELAFASGATPDKPAPPDTVPTLQQLLAAEIRDGLVSVHTRKDGKTMLELRGDKGLFQSGSNVLFDERLSLLKKVADVLATPRFASHSLTVVGHTDSSRIGTRNPLGFQDNFELSKARAQTVKDSLAKHQPGLRVSILGKAAVEPVADNQTKEGRARNRRVEIILD
ncbi:MAG: type IVB secretion system protein IcmH/DotU [Thiothrix litoralis]